MTVEYNQTIWTYKLIGDSSTWTIGNKDVLIKTPEAAAIIAKAAVISIYI